MKTLRTLCVVVVLSFTLTAPAFAGVISTDKTGTPPPPTSSMTTDGVISTDVTSQSNTGGDATTASSSVTEIALQLLQSAVSLF